MRGERVGIDGGAVDGGPYRTAGVVCEHHDERHLEDGDRVLQARHDGLADHLSGVAHHEEVTEAEVEDDLRGEAGVRAAEQRRDGVLGRGEVLAAVDVLVRVLGLVADEATVAVLHLLPGGGGGQRVGHRASETVRIWGMSDSASSAVESAEREP